MMSPGGGEWGKFGYKRKVFGFIHSSRKCFKYYVLGVGLGAENAAQGTGNHNPCPKNACELVGDAATTTQINIYYQMS